MDSQNKSTSRSSSPTIRRARRIRSRSKPKKQSSKTSTKLPCSFAQWKRLIESNPKSKQVNLYTCAETVEPEKRPTGWIAEYERQKCHKIGQMSQTEQEQEIYRLMTTYGVDPRTVPLCQKHKRSDPKSCVQEYRRRYPTENIVDRFFTRPPSPGEAIVSESTRQQLVSPCTCYIVAFSNTTTAQKLWIKERSYTISALLGLNDNALDDLQPYRSSFITLLCRLSPKHNHRFFAPVSGKVTDICRLGSQEESIQPMDIQNPRKSALIDNVRYILRIKTRYFGSIFMVIVGAPCVTSVSFRNPELQRAFDHNSIISGQWVNLSTTMGRGVPVHRRHWLGSFHWQSTILILVSASPHYHILDRIDLASQHQIETEIHMGQPILLSGSGNSSKFQTLL